MLKSAIVALIGTITGTGIVTGSEVVVPKKRKADEAKANEALKQFLNEGGRFVIKEQRGEIIIAIEAELQGQDYHMGIVLDSSDDLIRRWNNIVNSALRALRRKRNELKGEQNG